MRSDRLPSRSAKPVVFSRRWWVLLIAFIGGSWVLATAGQIGSVTQDWTQSDEVAGLPAARYGLGVGVLHGSLYAVGGSDDHATQTTLYRYFGPRWLSSSAVLPTARAGIAVGVLNGALYAVGGYAANLPTMTNVYRYQPAVWTEVAGLPAERKYMGLAPMNGSLYAVGGEYRNGAICDNVYRYNGTNWAEVARLPAARSRLAVAAWKGALYAIGGSDGRSMCKNVYRYDGTNWGEVASLLLPCGTMAAAALDDAVYVIGGSDGYCSQSNVFRYDGTNWTIIASLPAERSWLAAGVMQGSIYAVGGFDDSGARTNVYRFPRTLVDPGVHPASGSSAGGYRVVITGTNLGNGSDITGVSLCGVSAASIVSQSSTQVTIVARASIPGVAGVVAVYSASLGVTTRANAFTYTTPGIAVLGSNGLVIANGEAASREKGTDFGILAAGTTLPRTFVVTNPGTGTLIISDWMTNGTGASGFTVAGLPVTLAGGAMQSFTVGFAPASLGTYAASLFIANNATSYTVNVRGSACQFSTNTGPYAGGDTVTLTIPADTELGSGSDITKVWVGGRSGSIISQGVSWVTFTVPAAESAGAFDIVIQSINGGITTFADAYTYVNLGRIGSVTEDWTQWEEVAGLPAERRGLAAGVLAGTLYAVGGRDRSVNVYGFNGTNWTYVSDLPAARGDLAMAVLSNALYAMGGYDPVYGIVKANVYRYNGAYWKEVVGLPAARYGLAAGVLNGALYAIGGCTYEGYERGYVVHTNVYRYNGAYWKEVAGLPTALSHMGVGMLNGALYAVGGADATDYVTDVYRFDGTNWTEVAGLPSARGILTAGVLNGALYAIGGWGNDSGIQTNVYRFDGTNWTEVAGLPAARAGPAAEVLNGALYAMGGVYGGNHTNVYRYPRIAIDPGVNPSSGSTTGGYPVVITGLNLGDGSDITNVTLCGVPVASIVQQSITQVVVTAAAAAPPGLGDVRVFSTRLGETEKSHAFTYLLPPLSLRCTNVTPHVANVGGGIEVVLRGLYLGNGVDITNVTLAGVPADIVTQSMFEVKVLAGVAPAAVTGDVTVASGTGGFMVLSNAFEYLWLDAPVILDPVDITPTNLLARWEVADGAQEYRLDAAWDTNFAVALPGYCDMGIALAQQYTVTGLVDGVWVALRVRSWTANGYSLPSRTVWVPAGTSTPYETHPPSSGPVTLGAIMERRLTDMFHGTGLAYTGESSDTNVVTVGITPGGLLALAPRGAGIALITIRATDPQTGYATTVMFTMTVLGAPTLLSNGFRPRERWNPRFEQLLSVSNACGMDAIGVRALFTNLMAGIVVENQTGTAWDGRPMIEMQAAFPRGSTQVLSIVYLCTGAYRVDQYPPQIELQYILPAWTTLTEGLGLAVVDAHLLGDGSSRFVLEFESIPGGLYSVEYMNDFPQGIWREVPLRLRAGANRTQWIDSGPPATQPVSGVRAYRVNQVAE